MRTKWLAVSAATAALVMAACEGATKITDVNINTVNTPREGTIIGTRTDTIGNCIIARDFMVAGNLNLTNMHAGEMRDVFIRQSNSGTNCPALYTFHWTTSNRASVDVAKVDSVSGRVTAVAVGQAEICAIADQNSNVTICAPASVVAVAANQISISPSSVTVSSGTGCSLSQQFNAATNPSGLAVTWSRTNHVAGANLSSTGLYTFGAGSSGTDTVQASLATGEVARAVVVVNTSACSSANQVSVTPASVTLSSGTGCSLSQQFNASTNPSGLAVTWSRTNHVSGASLSSTGLYAFGAGSSGTDTVRATLATGESAIAVITVNASACTSPATITGISIRPSPVSLPVGTTVSPGQTYPGTSSQFAITIFKSDGSTMVNQAGTFTCSSSNTGVVSVNSSTCQETGVAVGQANITACANGTSFCDIQMVTVTAVSGGSIAFVPASACFSTISGSATTQSITINMTGMPSGTVVTLTTNSGGAITVSPTTITAPTGTVTLTRVGSTLTTYQVTATGNGVSQVLPVQVIATACPGTGNSIDYAPTTGNIVAGTPITLTATCVVNGVTAACPNQPFWTDDNGTLIDVAGNSTYTDPNGYVWRVGTTATVTRTTHPNTTGAPVTVTICVQWSLTATTPRACHPWTVP